MKKLAAILLGCLLAGQAMAQGVSRPPPFNAPQSVWSMTRSNAIAANALLGGAILPTGRSATLAQVRMTLYIASGGGAGQTVLRVCTPNSSGNCGAASTNVCSVTFACAATAIYGTVQGALSGSCSFPAGVMMAADVASSACTSAQGSISNFEVLATYQ